MSLFLSKKLLDNSNVTFTNNWLVFLRHPTSCANVMKALYSICAVSVDMCMFLSKHVAHLEAIYDIISEKVNFFYRFNFLV